MPRTIRLSASLLGLVLMTSGCFGPFQLTRRLYAWNAQAGDKWPREFMFLVLTWVPVYGVAVLGDAIVFNTIEFWTGKNPVDAPSGRRSAMPQVKRLVRGNAEVLLTYTPQESGSELRIQQFRSGRAAGSFHVQRRDGMTVGSDADGHVLFTARSSPDGSVVVRDVHGRSVAVYAAGASEQPTSTSRQ